MSAEAIILIPGIKGCQLMDTNTYNFQAVWRDVRFNFQDIENLELSKQYEGVYYDERMESIIERGPVESLAYREFMDDLETELPKFFFCYDWRLSNRENAKRLNDFIEMLKKKSRATSDKKVKKINKVNIVTHSMGNHICRFYIKDFGFGSINRVVFVCPPFLGSIAIVDTIIRGQGMFKNIKRKTRFLVKTFPGALELLPRYEKAAEFEGGESLDFLNQEHWQKNMLSYLEDTTDPWEKRVAEKFVNNLETTKQNVQDLDQWINDLNEDEKSRMLVIVRDEFKTVQAIQALGVERNLDFRGALEEDQGDGVVPHASSCCYHKEIMTLAIEDSIRYDDDSHAFVMTEERVQLLVSWFFDESRDFDYKIPGNSIKKVTKMQKVSKNGLTYHQVTKV